MDRSGIWGPILGLVIAVALFFLIAFVLPDSVDLVSLQQGVAVATVVATAPVAALASAEARLSLRVEAVALAYAVVLGVAMYAALSTDMMWTVIAVLLSALVASSTWWGRRLISPGTQVA